MVDWTATHIEALQSQPDKVSMLVDLELKKTREREQNKSSGMYKKLIHGFHKFFKSSV